MARFKTTITFRKDSGWSEVNNPLIVESDQGIDWTDSITVIDFRINEKTTMAIPICNILSIQEEDVEGPRPVLNEYPPDGI
jgi:hypothetical protein